MSFLFERSINTFVAAAVLRLGLLLYGRYQDAFTALKYTDIDYYVFTDAARNVAWGLSPYLRDTYRYTPLLAWLLTPTSWSGLWFDFGKVLFAIGDLAAGYLILMILQRQYRMPTRIALRYASLWLLNPMVATISTRGSSEGLLAVIVIALLWAVLQRRYISAGCLLGFAVHFKIYPFIYGTSILWWLEGDLAHDRRRSSGSTGRSVLQRAQQFVNQDRLMFLLASAVTFVALNVAMYSIYGMEFLNHTYLYHFVRTDHRHNFSPYNILLYMNSSPLSTSASHLETLAFVPQLCLCSILIPLAIAKIDLPACMFAQTLAFVAFNKVCTSQYFLWYLVFLPFYLPNSSLMHDYFFGGMALCLWVGGQALWLQQGYNLEMLGLSTFAPGLWFASLSFFAVNIVLLGVIILDVRRQVHLPRVSKRKEQ